MKATPLDRTNALPFEIFPAALIVSVLLPLFPFEVESVKLLFMCHTPLKFESHVPATFAGWCGGVSVIEIEDGVGC